MTGPLGWFNSLPEPGGSPNIKLLELRGPVDGYSLRPHSNSSVGHAVAELKPGTGSSDRSLTPYSTQNRGRKITSFSASKLHPLFRIFFGNENSNFFPDFPFFHFSNIFFFSPFKSMTIFPVQCCRRFYFNVSLIRNFPSLWKKFSFFFCLEIFRPIFLSYFLLVFLREFFFGKSQWNFLIDFLSWWLDWWFWQLIFVNTAFFRFFNEFSFDFHFLQFFSFFSQIFIFFQFFYVWKFSSIFKISWLFLKKFSFNFSQIYLKFHKFVWKFKNFKNSLNFLFNNFHYEFSH